MEQNRRRRHRAQHFILFGIANGEHNDCDVGVLRPITKFSAEIDSPDSVSEVIANAFRAAESGRPGAAFISVPKDIMTGAAEGSVLTPVIPELLGPADSEAIASRYSLSSTREHGG